MPLPGTVNVQKTLEAAQQLRLKKNDSQTEIIKDAVTQALTEDREKNSNVPPKVITKPPNPFLKYTIVPNAGDTTEHTYIAYADDSNTRYKIKVLEQITE